MVIEGRKKEEAPMERRSRERAWRGSAIFWDYRCNFDFEDRQVLVKRDIQF